jgi:hypothetical protein
MSDPATVLEISMGSATSAAITGTISPEAAVEGIKNHFWGDEVAALRGATDPEVRDRLKRSLPAFIWAGKFKERRSAAIERFSGLLCADIDKVPERIAELHDLARNDPHVVAAFVSPSGTGIKIVFRVPVPEDLKGHSRNFNAVKERLETNYKAQVDKAASDAARLCFVSDDPAAFYNAQAVALAVPADDPSPKSNGNGYHPVIPSSRRDIATKILGAIEWQDDVTGFCNCPGAHTHSTPTKPKDCMLKLEGSPTIKCFHDSCSGIVTGVNHELRSQIGKAEFKPSAPATPARRTIVNEYIPSEEESQEHEPNLVLEVVDAAMFMATPHPAPPQLIEGVLHQGSKMSISGNSKAYKTWIYADLAVSVSHGLPWLGFKTNQGKVLYLNFEVQDFGWHDRIAKLCEAKGVKIKPNKLHFWNLRGKARSFRQLIPIIIELAKKEGYALIVIDPIYKLMAGGEENSAGDIAEMLNSFERLAVETGAAVAYAHHFAKGNASAKEAIDRQSGSGVFGRDPDSLLIFTAHEEEGAFTVDTILRNFAPISQFVVRWHYPMMEPDDNLDPSKLKQVAGRKKEHDPAFILGKIANNTEANPISLSAWAELTGMPRTTLTGYLDGLRSKGWVKTVGDGIRAKQAITASGLAFLDSI